MRRLGGEFNGQFGIDWKNTLLLPSSYDVEGWGPSVRVQL